MNQHPVTDADLHAYVDGELPEARHAGIEAWLASHTEDAERVRTYRDQKLGLQQLFKPVLDEPLPAALRALADPSAIAGTRSPWFGPNKSLHRVAAGFAIAAISSTIGWVAHGRYHPAEDFAELAPLPRQAAIAHVVYSPDVKRPVEIGADQEDQLVTWLSKRLGTPVRPPRLGALGYELIGGRLLPGNSGPVAQFMYNDTSGQRLTLYVTTENSTNRDTAFRFAQEGPVNVFYWVDGKFGYALSAGIPKADLARVATAVYGQLRNT